MSRYGRRRKGRLTPPERNGVLAKASFPDGSVLAHVVKVYTGSDGDATMALYANLNKVGIAGQLCVHVFRAQKCSERAKLYRGGERGGPSYKTLAYERKRWSLEMLAKGLREHAAALEIGWGYAQDTNQPDQPILIYVDLPTGQVSWHGSERHDGPDYEARWDGIRGAAPDRICRWAASLLDEVKILKEAARS